VPSVATTVGDCCLLPENGLALPKTDPDVYFDCPKNGTIGLSRIFPVVEVFEQQMVSALVTTGRSDCFEVAEQDVNEFGP
jgi:hypothetical protein